jgi:hypothetical protein
MQDPFIYRYKKMNTSKPWIGVFSKVASIKSGLATFIA